MQPRTPSRFPSRVVALDEEIKRVDDEVQKLRSFVAKVTGLGAKPPAEFTELLKKLDHLREVRESTLSTAFLPLDLEPLIWDLGEGWRPLKRMGIAAANVTTFASSAPAQRKINWDRWETIGPAHHTVRGLYLIGLGSQTTVAPSLVLFPEDLRGTVNEDKLLFFTLERGLWMDPRGTWADTHDWPYFSTLRVDYKGSSVLVRNISRNEEHLYYGDDELGKLAKSNVNILLPVLRDAYDKMIVNNQTTTGTITTWA